MDADTALRDHPQFRERLQETYGQEFHDIDRGDGETSVGLRPAGDTS